MTICALVVTFNRPDYLNRCVKALAMQSKQLDEIIVVDNASRVPANEALASCYHNNIRYLRLKFNTGGAGGFYVGLREAFERGHDAVWVMDDDGAPEPTAFEALFVGAKRGGLGIANCLVASDTDHSILAFTMPIRGNDLVRVDQAYKSADENGIILDYVATFNGALISREAFEKIGNVKFECFIWGDEVEFKERARCRGVRLGTVVSSIHYHPMDRGSIVKIKPFAPVRICPPGRSHFHYRNVGYIYWKFMTRSAFVKNAISYIATLVFYGKIFEAITFALYYVDGASDVYALAPSRAFLRDKLNSVEANRCIQSADQ